MTTRADPASPTFAAQLRATVAGADPEEAAGGGAGAGAGAGGGFTAPPIVLPAPGGSGAATLVVVGSDPAARRAAMARSEELSRREAKRAACQAFVQRRRVQLGDLRRWAAAVPRAQWTQAATAQLVAAHAPPGGGAAAVGRGGAPVAGRDADAADVAALLAAFLPAPAAHSGGAAPSSRPHSWSPQPPHGPHPAAAAAAAAARALGPPSRGTTLRELLLSLSAFVGASREQRLLLCFELLDADGDGRLSRGELAEVLASQHLLGDAAWIAKKTDDVMALVDADRSGLIELGEFRQLALQFGSLLLPEYHARVDRAS